MTIRILMPVFFVFASLTAQALPTQKLHVQAVQMEEDKGPVTFVAYVDYDIETMKHYGSAIIPMEENVADTLAALSVNTMLECDARFFRNGRSAYVYALSNCK
ncbi:MAG: hypothetical protein V4760_00395 [Bdellovibrionota bacterium]